MGPAANILRFLFNALSKGHVEVMHNRVSLGNQDTCVTRHKYVFTKCSQIVKYYHIRQEHHSKSLFYGNFESGNQVYGRR